MAGIPAWAACLIFAAAAGWDLRCRRVPNAIPLALAALFAAHVLAGAVGPAAWWTHAAVGAALLAAGFVLYLTGGFGAGDGKLLAAAGLWVGPSDLSRFLFGLAIGALALALFALLPFPAARRMRRELPFAVAIALPAAAVVIPQALSHGIPFGNAE